MMWFPKNPLSGEEASSISSMTPEKTVLASDSFSSSFVDTEFDCWWLEMIVEVIVCCIGGCIGGWFGSFGVDCRVFCRWLFGVCCVILWIIVAGFVWGFGVCEIVGRDLIDVVISVVLFYIRLNCARASLYIIPSSTIILMICFSSRYLAQFRSLARSGWQFNIG